MQHEKNQVLVEISGENRLTEYQKLMTKEKSGIRKKNAFTSSMTYNRKMTAWLNLHKSLVTAKRRWRSMPKLSQPPRAILSHFFCLCLYLTNFIMILQTQFLLIVPIQIYSNFSCFANLYGHKECTCPSYGRHSLKFTCYLTAIWRHMN